MYIQTFFKCRPHLFPLKFINFRKTSVQNSNLSLFTHLSSASNSNSDCNSTFPCLDALEAKTEKLQQQSLSSSSGPEPHYSAWQYAKGYQLYQHRNTIYLDYGGSLPGFQLAYETWGNLNEDKSNAILLHTGLSASSHAKSHSENTALGWWEDFIGPNAPLDTNQFFIICTNVLGGCFGSTGPSSLHPTTHVPYATTFPLISLWDMVRCQHALIQSLGISKLWASVGSSMGGMQSLAYTAMYPDQVCKLVTISSCAKSHPYSIALRFVQRQIIMSDPVFLQTRGHYYHKIPPHVGMKVARELATITYRSGPEWEQRFARKRYTSTNSTQRDLNEDKMNINENKNFINDVNEMTTLCPDFEIEHYLAHQGEKFSTNYDANSLLYISKAMDLFDMSASSMASLRARARSLDTVPNSTPNQSSDENALILGMSPIQIPTLVLGVTSDCLFPLPQQTEIATTLKKAGNTKVTFYTLDSIYGHDTFLIDLVSVGAAIRGHLLLAFNTSN